MSDDINTLWALITASLLLVANLAVLLMVEGLSRRRVVSSGAAKHIVGAVGAILGVVTCGYALGYGNGGHWSGDDGFLLVGLDLARSSTPGGATPAAEILVMAATSMFFGSLVMAGLAERATHVAHLVVGLSSGGVIVPVVGRWLEPSGLLGSIAVDGETFLDAAAASVFLMTGWFGLIGTTIIGPRLGRIGSSGQVRAIPGQSPAAVSMGALLFMAGSFGLTIRPSLEWSDDVSAAALSMVIAGAAGAGVASIIGLRRYGDLGTTIASRGLVAGVVSVTGSPHTTDAVGAILWGSIGSALAVMAVMAMGHRKIDDPLGVVGVCGVAGLVGALTAGEFGVAQLIAQLVGVLIVSAVSIVAAGAVFGVLRLGGALRVRPEIEVVGLDL